MDLPHSPPKPPSGRFGLLGAGALLLALALLIASALTLNIMLSNLSDNRALVFRTNTILRALAELQADLRKAETGQRGYLLTAEERYLVPYRQAVDEVWSDLERLQDLVQHPAVVEQLQALPPLIEAKMDELAQTVALRERSFEAAMAVVRTDIGQDLTERINAAIHALRETERDLLEERAEREQQSALWTTRIAGLTGILAVISAVLGAVWFMRQRVQERLFASEARFHELAENVQDVFWMSNPHERRILYVNSAFEHVWGRPREAIYANFRVWTNAIAPKERARIEGAFFARALAGGYDETYRIERPDGSIRWIHDRGWPVHDETGKVRHVVGIAKDITERHRAQEALDARAKVLQEFADTLDLAPVFIRSLDGTIRFWNQGSCELYGWTRAEAVGRVSHELLATRFSEPLEAIERRLRTDRRWRGEVRHRRKDGAEVVIAAQWALHPREAAEPSTVIEVSTDITERIRAEAELKMLTEELEDRVAARTAELDEVNRELDAFAYTVSHDLRAPLRAMHGFAEVLLEDYGALLPEDGRRYAQRITAAANRMEALIEDILTYSRLSRQQVNLRRVSLDSVINQVIANAAPRIGQTGGGIEVRRPLGEVLGHQPTLTQAIDNLLSNAIKFVAPGVKPRIRIEAERRDRRLRLSIEDNGIGIPAEQQERIFQPFERLHGIESYPGTGVGLGIVRKSMERMGGTYGVASRPGVGSRFWIELPAAEEDGA